MLAGAFSSVLWTLLGSLIVVAGALVYGTLIRQISARCATAAPESTEAAPRRTFGLPEALLATGLVLFLLMSVTASVGRSPIQLSSRAGAEHRRCSVTRGNAIDHPDRSPDSKRIRKWLEQTGDCRSFQQLAHD